MIKIYEDVDGTQPHDDVLLLFQDRLKEIGGMKNLRATIAQTSEADTNVRLTFMRYSGQTSDNATTAKWLDKLAHGASLAQLRDSPAHSESAKETIREDYKSVKNEEPTEHKYAYWENRLATDIDYKQMRSLLSHSAAARQYISDIYYRATNQVPSASVNEEWQDKFAMGETAIDMQQILARSLTFEHNIQNLIAQVDLSDNKSASFILKNFAMQDLYTSGSFDVMRDNLVHNSIVGDFLNKTFETYIFHKAPNDLLRSWQASFLLKNNIENIKQEIIHSAAARQTINDEYIRILGRNAAGEEMSWYIKTYLDGGTAETMRHDIAFSNEAENLIREAWRANGWPSVVRQEWVDDCKNQFASGHRHDIVLNNIKTTVEQLMEHGIYA